MSIKYLIELTTLDNCTIQQMISDKQFWPNNCPPTSVDQLINWAIADYIDYYSSYLKNGDD